MTGRSVLVAACVFVSGLACAGTAAAESGADDYLAMLESQGARFSSYEQANEVVELGLQMCALVDSGASPLRLGGKFVEDGVPVHQAAAVISAALTHLCPENLPVLDRDLRRSSLWA